MTLATIVLRGQTMHVQLLARQDINAQLEVKHQLFAQKGNTIQMSFKVAAKCVPQAGFVPTQDS